MLPEQVDKTTSTHKAEKVKPTNRLGIIVTNLTAEDKEALQITKGVVVQEVGKGAAKVAGIQPGDIILRIGNEVITDLAAFEKSLVSLTAGKTTAVLIQRRGSPIFLALKIDK